MRITTGQALTSLCPTADFSASEENDGTNVQIYWHDKVQTQPTDTEIQAEIVRLQAEYDSKQYARKRKSEYPTIEECVHAILDGELDALQVKRQAVKDKYPKGAN
jgi:hypothetical protein